LGKRVELALGVTRYGDYESNWTATPGKEHE
jgi:hypothetical protein